MRARVKTEYGMLNADNNDVLLLLGIIVGGYYFITRQVVPDAFKAAAAAGGAVSTAANAAVNKGAQIITGDPYATAGTALYNITHPNDNAGAIAAQSTIGPGSGPQYDVGQNLVNNPAVFGTEPVTSQTQTPAFQPTALYDAEGNYIGG